MALRKFVYLALALALPAFMVPSAAQADGLKFHFQNNTQGCFSFGTTPGSGVFKTLGGTASPILQSVGTQNAGSHFTGNLGTLSITSGTLLSETFFNGHPTSLTYAPGGTISVVSSSAMGSIPAGTTLFTGTFGSNLVFKTTNPNLAFPNWTMSSSIKTVGVNSALLAMMGLPNQGNGTFSAVTMDISWKFAGGCLNG
ncbi:MAG: hypothetical protein GZ088_14830, partial [Acidipila sp.]|nr:hypothetical protein [Acidipila sp.]